jgi:hypothetical protein
MKLPTQAHLYHGKKQYILATRSQLLFLTAQVVIKNNIFAYICREKDETNEDIRYCG